MTSPRQRLPVDERRARLLDLGAGLFAARPYDDVAIDDIAAGAGISKGLLYHYFSGKREFYLAVLRRMVDELVSATEPPEGMDPDERLLVSLTAFVAYVDKHAVGYASLLRGGVGSDAEVVGIVEGSRERIVARVLDNLMDSPLDEPPEVLRVAVRGWVGLTEAAALEWVAGRRMPADDLVRLLALTLVGVVDAARAVDPRVPAPPADAHAVTAAASAAAFGRG